MDFKEIYAKYSPQIFRVCMGYINDYDQARDLTQETFISVWQNLSSFKQQSKISTWIFRIATNNCLRAIEKSKRKPINELPFDLAAPIEETQEEKLAFLYNCIAELEETDRIIISLVLEDKSYKDIAEITGSNINNVGVKISRIKARLLKLMENSKQYNDEL